MAIRGCAWRGGSILALALLASAQVFGQDDQPRPLSEQQEREFRAIEEIISATKDAQTAPNAFSMEWASHDVLMKIPTDRVYTPFTVTIDPSTTTTSELTVYWRVVSKETAIPADAPDEGVQDLDQQQPARFAYEDMNTAAVAATASRQAIRRFFTVPSGEYDVHVVVKEFSAKDDDAAAKVSYITHSLTVPDYWNDELTTSSVVVAASIEPLPTPLTPQQQSERPYALGAMEITPVTDSEFSTEDRLQTFMLIYNAKTDAQNKPDVTVEYSFYVSQDGAEKFFNKTTPHELNAQTLPPQFDMAMGHQLQSAQAVPLSSFPAGDYRLEITVTDKLADTSLTRDVNFSVVGS